MEQLWINSRLLPTKLQPLSGKRKKDRLICFALIPVSLPHQPKSKTEDMISQKTIKNALLWTGAFVAYRLYKLYEVGEGVIYKPVAVRFKRGKTLNDFVISVKVEIMNPQKTTVYLRGIDGELVVNDQIIGYFNSGKSQINPGLNYMWLDFRVSPAVVATLIQAIVAKKVPVLFVRMTTKLPYFSVTDTFAVNPQTVTTDQVFVN